MVKFSNFVSMKICVFNPDHDIVLGSTVQRFTPPHAARRLRRDLQFLPALWAEDGDKVLVEDVAEAQQQSRIFSRYMADVEFIDYNQLKHFSPSEIEVDAWGWDRAIAAQFGDLSPLNSSQTEAIRMASSRVFFTEQILPELANIDDSVLGISYVITRFEDLAPLLASVNQEGNYKYVIKAPWSSSGRGVRYVDLHTSDYSQSNITGWIKNILKNQGAITIEPFYRKVKDFGLEFNIDKEGRVEYKGLSLFETINGQYVGNILDTEDNKLEVLSRYVSIDLLGKIINRLKAVTSTKLNGVYCGPFGVDLMVVSNEGGYGFRVAFAELNLRRTMGHVALSLSKNISEQRVMRIEMNDRYRLHIYKRKDLEKNDDE
jgi:hypothetical protein